MAGGVGAELGGGKFINGAQTGAFSYLFNDAFDDLANKLTVSGDLPENFDLLTPTQRELFNLGDEQNALCAAGLGPCAMPSVSLQQELARRALTQKIDNRISIIDTIVKGVSIPFAARQLVVDPAGFILDQSSSTARDAVLPPRRQFIRRGVDQFCSQNFSRACGDLP